MNTELSINILHDQQRALELPKDYSRGEDYYRGFADEENKKCSSFSCCKRMKLAALPKPGSCLKTNSKDRPVSLLKYHYREKPIKRVTWSDEIIWEEPESCETPQLELNSVHISFYETSLFQHAGKRVCF